MKFIDPESSHTLGEQIRVQNRWRRSVSSTCYVAASAVIALSDSECFLPSILADFHPKDPPSPWLPSFATYRNRVALLQGQRCSSQGHLHPNAAEDKQVDQPGSPDARNPAASISTGHHPGTDVFSPAKTPRCCTMSNPPWFPSPQQPRYSYRNQIFPGHGIRSALARKPPGLFLVPRGSSGGHAAQVWICRCGASTSFGLFSCVAIGHQTSDSEETA